MADEPTASTEGGSTVNVNVQAPSATVAPAVTPPPLQPITILPPKATRTFSKWIVMANSALAWGAVFYLGGTSPAVAIAAFAMIAVFGASYMGVGHRDLALLLRSLAPVQIGTPPDTTNPETGEPYAG